MHPCLIVLGQPAVQVGLQLRPGGIELLAEREARELSEPGLMQPFADSVGLRTFPLGPGLIDIFAR